MKAIFLRGPKHLLEMNLDDRDHYVFTVPDPTKEVDLFHVSIMNLKYTYAGSLRDGTRVYEYQGEIR